MFALTTEAGVGGSEWEKPSFGDDERRSGSDDCPSSSRSTLGGGEGGNGTTVVNGVVVMTRATDLPARCNSDSGGGPACSLTLSPEAFKTCTSGPISVSKCMGFTSPFAAGLFGAFTVLPDVVDLSDWNDACEGDASADCAVWNEAPDVDKTDVLRESKPSGEGVLGINRLEGPATEEAMDKGGSLVSRCTDYISPPIVRLKTKSQRWICSKLSLWRG